MMHTEIEMRAAALDDPTRKAITRNVIEMLAELRHSMDVRAADCRDDAAEWTRAEHDLRTLMARAYVRNHNIIGLDA